MIDINSYSFNFTSDFHKFGNYFVKLVRLQIRGNFVNVIEFYTEEYIKIFEIKFDCDHAKYFYKVLHAYVYFYYEFVYDLPLSNMNECTRISGKLNINIDKEKDEVLRKLFNIIIERENTNDQFGIIKIDLTIEEIDNFMTIYFLGFLSDIIDNYFEDELDSYI